MFDGNGITGTATATLTLTGTTAASAGTYSVLVTDGLGVVGSTAVLAVETPTEVALAITRKADGNVRVSWPSSVSGATLQSATALPGSWTNAPEPVVIEATEHVVTVAPSAATRYFRLSLP